jgi:hypothetical protein
MPWTTAGNIKGPKGDKGDPGQTGSQGPQGEVGPAGPAGLNWRGNWAAGTAYAVNDSVAYSGATYFATASHATSDTTPPTNESGATTQVNPGWAVLALEGAQGAQGPQGDPGPKGDPGVKGDTGNTGAPGTRGSQWYTGTGAPGTISGSIPGDKYLDTSSGDVYTLT